MISSVDLSPTDSENKRQLREARRHKCSYGHYPDLTRRARKNYHY